MRHEAESAGYARRSLVDDLIRAGLPPSVIDDAALLITELVTNAVRYAKPLPGDVLRVSWEFNHAHLLLCITDGGSRDSPHRLDAGPRDTRGRGLAIVDAVAARWGVERAVGNLSTVWAELPVRPANSGTYRA